MHRTFNKPTCFLILFLVITPFICSIFFVAKLIIIKSEITEVLQSRKVLNITVPENEVHWIDAGNELLINGKLFDAISYQKIKNNLILTGSYDREEDNLQDDVARFFQKKGNDNGASNIVYFNTFFRVLFMEKNNSFSVNIDSILPKKHVFYYAENLVYSSSDIILPPPKV